MKKDKRYYLAIDIGQYIVEGHKKSEALAEFNITKKKFDSAINYLECCNYQLYILAKQKLDQYTYFRAQKICKFICEGHTKVEASKQFSVGTSTIDRAIKIIHEKNLALYQKTKQQLDKNQGISNPIISTSV